MQNPIIDVLIPAYNEEEAIPLVIKDIPKALVRDIIVCDNNSKDKTNEVAKAAGATVVFQPNPGYGNACLKGMEFIAQKAQKPDIVMFIDGDFSDYPQEMSLLLKPILEQNMDMVIGSRLLGNMEKGAMTPPQRFGNWLSTTLIRWIYGYHFTDLGPFRAIQYEKLLALNMEDKNFGWTVEMQVKAARKRLNCCEIAVNYRRRAAGVSKVSGTIRGTFLAGYKILYTIAKYSII